MTRINVLQSYEKRAIPRLEELERRLVPASLINPTTLIYTDVDGDQVTVRVVGHGSPDPQLALDDFTFAAVRQGEQLQQIDLSGDPSGFAGSDLEIDVVPNGGDGLANIGYISAAGVDLGAITVPGDLGRIDAGSGNSAAPALQHLAVHSLGQMGVSTQAPGGNLESNIAGAVGELQVDTDIQGAAVRVVAPSFGGPDPGPEVSLRSTNSDSTPLIGQIVVGGSIVGQDELESGFISCEGDIGSIEVAGNVKGGTEFRSGAIDCRGRIDQLLVGESILGGAGIASASINAREIGEFTVGGSIIAGSGSESANIAAIVIHHLTVDGSVRGTLDNPARITAFSQVHTEVRTVERVVPEIVFVEVCRPDGTCVEEMRKTSVVVHMQVAVTVEDRARLDSLSIHGDVDFAEITAGVDGQIGTVTVDGNWHASSLAAGVTAGDDGRFGTDDDTLFIRAKDPFAGRVQTLTIGGQVQGTSSAEDHFGIVARQIDAFFANAASKIRLRAGAGNDDYLLGLTGVRLREVPAFGGLGGGEP